MYAGAINTDMLMEINAWIESERPSPTLAFSVTYCMWYFVNTQKCTVLTCSTSQSLSSEALNFFKQESARFRCVEYCKIEEKRKK